MHVRRNRWGEEKQYYQAVRMGGLFHNLSDKYFEVSDVLHIAYDRMDGYAWGRPFVISVLDDIRLLRSLEEMASLMCFKSAIPMYQYKVGSEQMMPIQYTDGSTELDKVEDDIREKDSHGFFVTPGHHDLKNVDGGNNVRDITKYLDFFRSRVISGLNLSSVDLGMGDTSNRSTANEMSKNLQAKCKDFQNAISEQMQEFFDELLLEGGYQITPETKVSLFWKEIDVEGRRIIENHIQSQYQGHLITFPEARREIGREPLVEAEEKEMFFHKVEIPRIEVTGEQKMKLGSATTGSQKSTASKEKPKNQHGTRGAAKPKGDSVHLLSLRVKALFGLYEETYGDTILDEETGKVLKDALREAIEEVRKDSGVMPMLSMIRTGASVKMLSGILMGAVRKIQGE
jgi:hypothetical protein